jgi:SsrA-binding protein
MGSKRKTSDSLPSFSNSKARHKFLLGDKFVAGIELLGTEVKSIRNGKAQISESFARFTKDQLYLLNAYVDEYPFGNENNHEPTRPRKLLLNRRELSRLQTAVEASGKTIVPLKLFFKGSLIKCELALGTGKNQRDKRQDLKKRVAQREAEQAMKNSLKR